MAKWKGPFTVTKIPTRFQVEYLDDDITRLTHISYAKKYNERCPDFARERAAPRTEGQSSQTVGKDGTGTSDLRHGATPKANGGTFG